MNIVNLQKLLSTTFKINFSSLMFLRNIKYLSEIERNFAISLVHNNLLRKWHIPKPRNSPLLFFTKQKTLLKMRSVLPTLLAHKDSNLERRHQKPECYHYTMGQFNDFAFFKAGANLK